MNGDPATVWLYGFVIAAWALLTAWPGERAGRQACQFRRRLPLLSRRNYLH